LGSGGLLACLILVDVSLIDCVVTCMVVWTENWIVGWVLRVGSIRLSSSVDGSGIHLYCVDQMGLRDLKSLRA